MAQHCRQQHATAMTRLFSCLIRKGADVNAVGGYFGTALQAAAHCDHGPMVRQLLKKGADVNAIGGKYGTALQAAACSRYSNTNVPLLLMEGADVNAMGGKYGTALQAAMCTRYSNPNVQLLLKRTSRC